jgi:hypothetical protein
MRGCTGAETDTGTGTGNQRIGGFESKYPEFVDRPVSVLVLIWIFRVAALSGRVRVLAKTMRVSKGRLRRRGVCLLGRRLLFAGFKVRKKATRI